jgi:hypothetical protein
MYVCVDESGAIVHFKPWYFVKILIFPHPHHPDPHPDPLVRGTDPRIQIRIRIRSKTSQIPDTDSYK